MIVCSSKQVSSRLLKNIYARVCLNSDESWIMMHDIKILSPLVIDQLFFILRCNLNASNFSIYFQYREFVTVKRSRFCSKLNSGTFIQIGSSIHKL